EERALVSPVAGTTRDTVDTVVQLTGRRVRLVDTAGIRRRGVIGSNVEHYSVLRALRALERSDVGVLVLDAAQGVVAQDRHVAGYAADAGKGLVVVANKWDLLEREAREDRSFLEKLRKPFNFVHGAPFITVSALLGRNVEKVLPAAIKVAEARATRIPTPALNNLLREAMDSHPPQSRGGERLKLLYAAQARTPTPTIVLFVNNPELIHFSYKRYLENRIREAFGFAGSPLRLVLRKRGEVAQPRSPAVEVG
ncbi:MAG TPA: GTP-binding protein, partial [Candidatus Sulfotelmatobacter sp.]|nr:GTP-binding protein [Candidatus Sulfotelmatobacter sp.]